MTESRAMKLGAGGIAGAKPEGIVVSSPSGPTFKSKKAVCVKILIRFPL